MTSEGSTLVQRGSGMDQGAARRRARELGGIAVSARPRTGNADGWHLGGWPMPGDVWIVIDVERVFILDDGSMEEVKTDGD